VKARGSDMAAFGGAAAAVGLSAVVAQAVCPGPCVTCANCMASLVPMAGAGIAVAAALGGSALRSASTRRAESRSAGLTRPPRGGTSP